MNKRQKKKLLIEQLIWAVEELRSDVGAAHSRISQLEQENESLKTTVSQLGGTVNRNSLVTNNRFEQLGSENKVLREELAELKRAKKPFWKK